MLFVDFSSTLELDNCHSKPFYPLFFLHSRSNIPVFPLQPSQALPSIHNAGLTRLSNFRFLQKALTKLCRQTGHSDLVIEVMDGYIFVFGCFTDSFVNKAVLQFHKLYLDRRCFWESLIEPSQICLLKNPVIVQIINHEHQLVLFLLSPHKYRFQSVQELHKRGRLSPSMHLRQLSLHQQWICRIAEHHIQYSIPETLILMPENH